MDCFIAHHDISICIQGPIGQEVIEANPNIMEHISKTKNELLYVNEKIKNIRN